MPDSEHLEPERARVEKYGDGWTIWVEPGPCRVVAMDCCGFTFDAGHEDVEGGYSCPLCSLTSLEAERDEARADRDQWKRAANGDASGLVTNEYLLRVMEPLVAERKAAETRAAQWEGSFNGMVEVEKRLLARLEAVREWAEGGCQFSDTEPQPIQRNVANFLRALLDPADGGAEQFNENPDEFHARPDPETYRGGGVMGRKRPADGEEG